MNGRTGEELGVIILMASNEQGAGADNMAPKEGPQ
jgi:hypothetical protein